MSSRPPAGGHHNVSRGPPTHFIAPIKRGQKYFAHFFSDIKLYVWLLWQTLFAQAFYVGLKIRSSERGDKKTHRTWHNTPILPVSWRVLAVCVRARALFAKIPRANLWRGIKRLTNLLSTKTINICISPPYICIKSPWMFDVRVIKSAEHLCDIRSLCCVQADRCWEVSSEYYLARDGVRM